MEVEQEGKRMVSRSISRQQEMHWRRQKMAVRLTNDQTGSEVNASLSSPCLSVDRVSVRSDPIAPFRSPSKRFLCERGAKGTDRHCHEHPTRSQTLFSTHHVVFMAVSRRGLQECDVRSVASSLPASKPSSNLRHGVHPGRGARQQA